MPLNLIVDRVVKGKIYPALARFQAQPFTPEWRQFSQHWPNTVPLRLQEYFETHGPGISVFDMHDSLPHMTFYAIGLSWFDFSIDYFALLPPLISDRVLRGEIRVLFFYHEGDNPSRIKQRLDSLAAVNGLSADCYLFISSNSASDRLPRFVSFQDSELWFWHRNLPVRPCAIYSQPRQRDFTALNRLHKWWRAAIMADLRNQGVLDRSYWSYCDTSTTQEPIEDCPIAIDDIPSLRPILHEFLRQGPYFADDLSQDQRNDHSTTIERFYLDAYCHIVLETMFDYDQSHGVLLSEKTFKPIKHGQMFFIAGAAGSLALLRDMGYRTFDHVLDNSYDLITDNTQRWLSLRQAIKTAHARGLANLFQQARSDIEHNQQLFCAAKTQRLSKLLNLIHEKSS